MTSSSRIAKHAGVQVKPRYSPDVESLVLFELRDTKDQPVYLLIRFYNWAKFEVEGDHLFILLEEALHEAQDEYGISASDWQDISDDERKRVDDSIQL